MNKRGFYSFTVTALHVMRKLSDNNRINLSVIRIKVLSTSFAVEVSYNAFFLTGRFFALYPYVVMLANGRIKHYQV